MKNSLEKCVDVTNICFTVTLLKHVIEELIVTFIWKLYSRSKCLNVYVHTYSIVFSELYVILIKRFTFLTALHKFRKRHFKLRKIMNFG
jgi:hypothetical protein